MGRLETPGKNAKQGPSWLRSGVACRALYGLLLAAFAVPLASCDNFGGSVDWASYTIIYHANDGSGRTERFTVNYGTPHAIREYTFGHDASFFQGWESPYKARIFDAGYSVRKLATNAGQTISLYAIWDGYIVAFHPNGGSGNVPWPRIGIGSVELPGHNGLEKDDHVFVGWSITQDESEDLFLPGQDFELTWNITLYAVWVLEALVYVVDFDANGGRGEGPPRSVVSIGYDTLLPLSYGFYRDGHAFVGWGLRPDAMDYFVAGAIFTPSGNVTLYAVWAPTVTLRFEAGGEWGLGPGPITGRVGSSIRLPYRNGLSRPGHIFAGWSTRPGESLGGFLSGQIFYLTGNITLYAVWRPAAGVDFFIVTFDANNGPGAVPSPRVAISGIGIMLPAGEPLPGYVFVGWGLRPDEVDYVAGARFTPAENLTLYAEWREADAIVDYFIVTFDADDGPGTVPLPMESVCGIGISLPAGLPLPGYVFVGWSLARGASEADYEEGDMFVPTGDITLYALWGRDDPGSGTGDFNISLEDFFDIGAEIIGPTLRIVGSPDETTGRITLTNPGQYDPGSIRWFLGGVEINAALGVVSGGMGETLTLDSRLHNNHIRTHQVTVVVRKEGVPFSKVIVFTVVP